MRSRVFFLTTVTLLTILAALASAQEITVKDRATLRPIERATVYNIRSGASGVTGPDGVTAIENTRTGDTLRIRHLGYHDALVTVTDLTERDITVLLSEKLLDVGEVVVSANKWEEKRDEIPVQIASVSAREVAFKNPQTSADMLANLGGVFVQKSQMGGGSPVLRGFEANQVLIVVDGVRMNNAIFRSGHLQNVIMLDPASIGEAEVVFGPGSVMYGSDALGGVMDFHTYEPRYGPWIGLEGSGGAFARYASANNEKTGHLHFNLGFAGFASLTSVTYSDYGDLRRGNVVNPFLPDWGKRFEYVDRINGEDVIVQNDDPNVQKYTGYSQLNLLQKFRYRISDSWDAQYGLYYATSSDVPRYDRLQEYRNGALRYAEWYYGPQNWMMNALTVNYTDPGAFVDHGRLTIAYQQIEEDRISRSFGSDSKRHQEEDVNVLSVNLDLDKELVPGVHRLFYGAEAVFNDVTSTAYTENIVTGEQTPTGTRYPAGGNTMNTFAAYATYKWIVAQPFLVSAGIRYSHVLLNSKIGTSVGYKFPYDEIDINAGALNGSLGFVYRPEERWQFNLNFSSGFRAPNVDDAGKVFDSSPGSVMVPNPDLAPEYAYNGELTALYKPGMGSVLSVTGYYTMLTDAIVRQDFTFNGQDSILYDGVLSRVQANQNAGEAYIYGFTGRATLNVTNDLTLDGSITSTYGWDTSNDEPLAHIPPLFASGRMIYRLGHFRCEAEIRWNDWKRLSYFSPAGEDNLEDATPLGTPDWYVLNLRTAYTITSYLQINLDLENVMDVHYRPFASGVSAPGRNLILALRTTF